MAKFLNTSATNYFLEELIKDAKDRVILISPFLKLNDRVRELLEDKNRLKIDVRVVYGKSELSPEEMDWLNSLTFIRTSFCKNLHAKCYINEELCIVTSLNLYQFSQVNNNEMGILLRRSEDPETYKDAYEEAQRIIRISEEVRVSLERVTPDIDSEPSPTGKLTTSKLAKKLGKNVDELLALLVTTGYLVLDGDKHVMTQKAKDADVKFIPKGRFGAYFLWPETLRP